MITENVFVMIMGKIQGMTVGVSDYRIDFPHIFFGATAN